MIKITKMTKSIIIAMGVIGTAYANNHSVHHSLLNGWTGYYAGMDAGFAFSNPQVKAQQLGFTNSTDKCHTTSDYPTFFPGIQLGYMRQFPNALVSGIEVNATFNTNRKDRLGCISAYNANVYDDFSFKNQMQSSIKGRLGRALKWHKSNLLPYLTAGASFADVGLSYKNEGGDHYSKHSINPGFLIGAGVEWAIRQNWSLRVEYSYVDYGDVIKLKIPSVYGLIDPHGHARINLNSNNVIVAINYWI